MKKIIPLLFAIIILSFINSCSVKPACSDGKQNQGEFGVDCGGPCTDCPTCMDGIQNQNETGIDCGGECIPCATCSDGIQNQNETGIDCGGPCQSCNPIIYPRQATLHGETQDNLLNDSTVQVRPHAYTVSAILPTNTSIIIRLISLEPNKIPRASEPPAGWTFTSIPNGREFSATGPTSGTILMKFDGDGKVEILENGATVPTKVINVTW